MRASTGELVDAIVASRTWADFGLERRRAARARRARRATLAAVLRAFYGLYADARGKPRWGDKTPGYVKRMRPIGDAARARRASST